MADGRDEPGDGALPVTGAFAPIRLPEEWRDQTPRQPAHHQRPEAPDPDALSPSRIKAARRRRRLIIFSALLSTVVLLLTGALWAGFAVVTGNVDRVDNPETVAAAPNGPLNILVAGVDDVKGLTKRQRDLLSLNGERSGNRTDTLMVLRLSSDHKRVTVVSIPRDTWVEIPGHGPNKINSAYAFGGPKTTTKVVKRLTGLPINHYIEVNPMGLVKIIDRLGGIEMCVPNTITDPKINFSLEKGASRRLGGVAASKFARTRAVDNDFGRMKRQQQVISATLKKALSGETLTNPARLTGFVTEAAKSVKVDDNLSGDMLGLAEQLKTIDMDQVQFTQLPVANPDFRPFADSEDENQKGVSAVQYDTVATRQLFDALKADRPLVETDEKPKADGGNQLEPSDVRVRVLNGGGVTGKGAEAREDLRELGFKVPKKAGDTDPANHKKTFVRYTEGHEDEAKLVAGKFPGATTKLVKRGAPVTLVAGETYGGPKESGPPKDLEASTAKDNNKAVDCKRVAS